MCGDLGYDTYCPGGGQDLPEAPAPNPREYDFTPPDPPSVGEPTAGRAGAVRLPVAAEKGSRIEVLDETDRAVARATGTGRTQAVRFTADSGTHTYTVRATDRAGNVSDLSRAVTVEADASAPSLDALDVVAGSPDSEASTVTFTTEPGASYTVSVPDTKQTVRGLAAGTGSVSVPLWLRNGRYTVSAAVRDAAGNTRAATAKVVVAIARPALAVRQVSRAGASPVVYEITASPRSHGTVSAPGQRPASFTVDVGGTTNVSLPLADGRYGAGTVTLTDFAGRTASAHTEPVTVDTVPPALTVTADEAQADKGFLALDVTAEPGARVAVTGDLDGGHRLDESFLAGPAARRLSHATPTGTYAVTVIATDAVGNQSRQQLRVHVTRPLTAAELALGLGALFVLLALGCLAGWLLWRRRASVSAWLARRREAAAARAEERRVRALLAAHERQVAEYRKAHDAWEQADQAWNRRRGELVELLALAEHETGWVPHDFPLSRLRRGERVLAVVNGSMVEARTRQGVAYTANVGTGIIAVTNQRILFSGARRREWAFDKLQDVRHLGVSTTMMRVANRQSASGVDYPEQPERTRLLIDLAIADTRGQRQHVIATIRERLASHDHGRPAEPIPPSQPPVAATGGIT